MAMKRRWFELLLGLGAVHSATATSASPSVKQPLTFYVNKPPASAADSNRAIQTSVQSSRNADRKSTRLNSSHSQISYAVFCLKKKRNTHQSKIYQRIQRNILVNVQLISEWIH